MCIFTEYILIAEKTNDEFLNLRIVDRNHDDAEKVANQVSGELEDNPAFNDDVLTVLNEYRTQVRLLFSYS